MEWFLPGEQAGGPVSTVRGLIRHLGSVFDIAVVCRDRDLGDARPYRTVPIGRWVEIDGQQRWYLSARSERLLGMLRVLRATNYDVLFVNTLFSVSFCLIPLVAQRLRLIPRRRVLLAPRGQLDPAALRFSSRRKRLFLAFLKMVGALREVEWAASTPDEALRIRTLVGVDATVHVTPNLRAADAEIEPTESMADGKLRVCFLSRISPMKNLLEALHVLKLVSVPVQFDIFGPREDIAYWQTCDRAIAGLPSHVQARWMGAVAHDEVQATLSRYDMFLLPTLCENFGHAIIDALAAGCPVMISDRTPWRRLAEHNVGWDLPLGEPTRWAAVIEGVAADAAPVRHARREAARRFGALVGQSPDAVEANYRALATRART